MYETRTVEQKLVEDCGERLGYHQEKSSIAFSHIISVHLTSLNVTIESNVNFVHSIQMKTRRHEKTLFTIVYLPALEVHAYY